MTLSTTFTTAELRSISAAVGHPAKDTSLARTLRGKSRNSDYLIQESLQKGMFRGVGTVLIIYLDSRTPGDNESRPAAPVRAQRA
jgi:hypothetical protein